MLDKPELPVEGCAQDLELPPERGAEVEVVFVPDEQGGAWAAGDLASPVLPDAVHKIAGDTEVKRAIPVSRHTIKEVFFHARDASMPRTKREHQLLGVKPTRHDSLWTQAGGCGRGAGYPHTLIRRDEMAGYRVEKAILLELSHGSSAC